MCAKKNFIWNPATCSCENGMMTCDEIIEKTNNPNKCCSNKLYFSKFQDIVILLITIVLLIAVVIYCSLIKYKAKQKKKPY